MAHAAEGGGSSSDHSSEAVAHAAKSVAEGLTAPGIDLLVGFLGASTEVAQDIIEPGKGSKGGGGGGGAKH